MRDFFVCEGSAFYALPILFLRKVERFRNRDWDTILFLRRQIISDCRQPTAAVNILITNYPVYRKNNIKAGAGAAERSFYGKVY